MKSLFLEPWAIRPCFCSLYCGVGYLPSTILLFVLNSYRIGFYGATAPFTVQSLITAEGADYIKTAKRSFSQSEVCDMAAFISSTWQGTSTRIPETRVKLPEWMAENVVRKVLTLATPFTRKEANAFMRGNLNEMSHSTIVELKALITGYVR